jgi:hypothetical protein
MIPLLDVIDDSDERAYDRGEQQGYDQGFDDGFCTFSLPCFP